MEKKQIIISGMWEENNTNGVSRYTEMLLDGIPANLYEIIKLEFVHSKNIRLPKSVKHPKFLEITIPLPIDAVEILESDYWRAEYNKVSVHILEPYLKRNGIIHIQTTNLIDFAIYLRQLYNYRIVSHIHCIPWKYNYTIDRWKFNVIYKKLNIEGANDGSFIKYFAVKDEYKISQESDAIICVTNSAKNYYAKYLRVPNSKLFCIYNGIRDELEDHLNTGNALSSHDDCRKPVRLLFVGGVTREKGFQYILEALQIVKAKGYKFELKAAGKIEKEIRSLVERKYADLDLDFLGVVDYVKLCSLYRSAQIGLVPSLFEQCSYVALEMSMFGLPVLFSDIDELHEVFSENKEMSIPVKFSPHAGLSLDVVTFAGKIMRLIDSRELREQIGRKMRERYVQYFGLDQMIYKTIGVYNSVFNYEKKS